MTGYVSK